MKLGFMMNKYTLFCLLGILSLFASCRQKDAEECDTFQVQRIQSKKVWVEVIPKTNDNYYMCGVATLEDFRRYQSDSEFIEADYEENMELYGTLCDIFHECGYETMCFEDMMCYNGAISETYAVEPETQYIAYVYFLDAKKRPSAKLSKEPFTTPASPCADLTFVVEPTEDDATLRIEPRYKNGIYNDKDTYFYDFERHEEVLKSFEEDLTEIAAYWPVSVWFSDLVCDYCSWGFMPAQLSKNTTLVDFSLWYDLQEGDTFDLGCVGYAHNDFTAEESTFAQLLQAVYHEGRPLELHTLSAPSLDDADNDDAVKIGIKRVLDKAAKRID